MNNCIYSYIQTTPKQYISECLESTYNPIMDVTNITNIINNYYLDSELKCSKQFLEIYLTIVTHLFDQNIYISKDYLNENDNTPTTIYINEYPESIFDHYIIDNITTDKLIPYFEEFGFSFIEHYLLVQLNLVFKFFFNNTEKIQEWNSFFTSLPPLISGDVSNITKWSDFLNIKINQPILLLNPILLNTDRRSISYTGHIIKDDTPVIFSHTLPSKLETKFDIYCKDGFTILEYLVHVLTIRGNPYDRRFTSFESCIDRSDCMNTAFDYYITQNSIKFEEKYKKMVENEEIKDDYTIIYLHFDHIF